MADLESREPLAPTDGARPDASSLRQGIRIRLDVSFPDFRLDVELELPGRGVTALFGHSGSGKTTLLRCVAGLEPAARGVLTVNGACWQDSARGVFVPPHRRELGYVFQEASLFAHLSVRRNLAFGLRRIPPAARKVSLDHKRKQEVLPYLERLHDELDIPVLYVSHAAEEVVRLADHIVMLGEGRVMAAGELRATMARLDLPTAFTEDAGVVVEGRVAEHDDHYHLTRLDFPGGAVWVSRQAAELGRTQRFRIHARDVSLADHQVEGSSIVNLLPVVIEDIVGADTPAHVLVRMDAGGTPLVARITRRSSEQLVLRPGRRMWAQIKSVALLA